MTALELSTPLFKLKRAAAVIIPAVAGFRRNRIDGARRQDRQATYCKRQSDSKTNFSHYELTQEPSLLLNAQRSRNSPGVAVRTRLGNSRKSVRYARNL